MLRDAAPAKKRYVNPQGRTIMEATDRLQPAASGRGAATKM
jgi:hypothetical protein